MSFKAVTRQPGFAREWRVSSRCIYDLCARGELGHLRIGGQIRIRQQDREAYEARQWRAPSSKPQTTASPSEATAITVQWWEDGKPRSVSTGKTDKREAAVWLNQFIAGRGSPEAPTTPSVDRVIIGYLADRKPVVRAYDTLETAAKALTRHLGDLQPDHLTKERIRFYRAQRRAEGHMVGAGSTTVERSRPVTERWITRN